MRDIYVTLAPDGSASVEPAVLYAQEHNSVRLIVALNEELKAADNSFLCLCFDPLGLGEKIVSNNIKGEPGEGPAYRQGDAVYCPLPQALTATGKLLVQLEAHRLQAGEADRICKSAGFSLELEPSVSGEAQDIAQSWGLLPQLQAAIEAGNLAANLPAQWQNNPPTILASGQSSSLNARGDVIPSHLTVGARAQDKPVGDYSVTVGSDCSAGASGSLAVGTGVHAASPNSLVVGTYATPAANTIFAVGTGSSAQTQSLGFFVSNTRVQTNLPMYGTMPASADNSTRFATTAYVKNNLHQHGNLGVLNYLGESVTGALTYKGVGIGGGGTDYTQLANLPKINGVVLTGNLSAGNLSLAAAEDVADLQDALDAKAASADVVRLTGTQNIAGAKTFTGIVAVPAPTADSHAVTKAYADGGNAAALASANAYTNSLVGNIASALDAINGEVA